MKKILVIPLIAFFISACTINDSRPSISKVEEVPEDVYQLIDPAATLQLINEDGEIAYLIFNSQGSVTADVKKQGNTLNIRLKTANKEDHPVGRHVYEIITDENPEKIQVFINGKSSTIDNISSF